MSEKKTTMGSTETIWSALHKAQSAIEGVAKDGTVDFGRRYAYTSAEEMIRECRLALHACGLSLIRTGWRVGVVEAHPMLLSDFRLLHYSGESFSFNDLSWPIIEGDKRPLDKAVAGALTTSLAYFLRDLLLVPKEDEAQMDKRNDEGHRPRSRPADPPSEPPELAVVGTIDGIGTRSGANGLVLSTLTVVTVDGARSEYIVPPEILAKARSAEKCRAKVVFSPRGDKMPIIRDLVRMSEPRKEASDGQTDIPF